MQRHEYADISVLNKRRSMRIDGAIRLTQTAGPCLAPRARPHPRRRAKKKKKKKRKNWRQIRVSNARAPSPRAGVDGVRCVQGDRMGL
jgi:hypothetical protein